MTRRTMVCVCALGLFGCNEVTDLDPYDDTPPVEARVRPKPITGGTLAIGSGLAIAADPDRDLVHVVDLESASVRHTIALDPGDEPGRVIMGDEGVAHVVLRGFGGVATLDLDAGKLTSRHRTCPDPRGLALAAGSLHIACADGSLVELDAATGDELGRVQLDPDLRDVIPSASEILVSRFRSASVVGTAGSLTVIPSHGSREPHVAWRTWADPNTGNLLMLHHMTSVESVPTKPRPADFDGGETPAYGGGNSCQPGISVPAITIVAQGESETILLTGEALTVDAALSPDSQWLAIATPGAAPGKASFRVKPLHEPGCAPDFGGLQDDSSAPLGQVTAVAFDADGLLVMQSREPARLLVQSQLPDGEIQVIELEGESRFDSGHEIFHRATESGLSCATCHPEGTDDGHVWKFDELGKRRTQPLDVALAETAPFHWDGEMDDLDVLMSEVLAHRMGGKRQSDARSDSFRRWLFALERPPADTGREDPELVATGQALFAAHLCTKCHTGGEFGGANTELYADAELQVPSLRRVALRAPYMHDGRSATLEAAVEDMLDVTIGRDAGRADVDALAAYLRTL